MTRRNARVFFLWLGLCAWSTLVEAFRSGGWQRRFLRQQVKPIASFLTNNEVSSEKWIESVFGGMQPSHILIQRTNVPNNSDEDTQCIIDNPSTTLANPLLGVNISSLSSTVLDAACKPPGYRIKPVLVTVRGTGGGKTRLLEELRQDLQRNSNVLPIAITFNAHTCFDSIEFRVPSGAVSTALSIVARMASAFYGLSFLSVKGKMKNALSNLCVLPEDAALNMYTSFVQLMGQQMQEAGCPVETFVLMIDETVRLQSQLLKKYPDDTDPLSDLRSALLNQIRNAALVLSSLQIEIPGVTDSGRPIIPLQQCESLDSGEIVNRWWNITDSHLQHRFRLVAAALCDLPRAVELANTYIQHHRADIAQSSFSVALIQNVTQEIQRRYPVGAESSEFPSPSLLRAMLFKFKYRVDREVTGAIRDSLLTNVLGDAIKRTSMQRDMSVMIVPRVNLLMLSIQADDPKSFSGQLLELLRHIIHTTVQSTDDEGDLLEEHTALMLNARVGVSMYRGSTVTLAELLGLDPVDLGSPLRTKIRLTEEMASDWKDKVQTLKYSSNTRASKFLEEIESIKVSEEMPIALRLSAAGESFDIFVKVYDAAAPAKCYYAVIENKSEQETSQNANQTTRSFATIKPKLFPKNGKQAKRVCKVMAQLTASTTYLYFTTRAVEQAVYKPPLQPNVMWVFTGRDVVKKFMGPLWDLHRTYREGLFERCVNNQKKN